MSLVAKKDLDTLKAEIKTKGYLDREELLKFLTLIPTNDAPTIIKETQNWLNELHRDPDLPGVIFPQGDISSIIGDLDSYGRVQPSTIQDFKQTSTKAPPQTS